MTISTTSFELPESDMARFRLQVQEAVKDVEPKSNAKTLREDLENHFDGKYDREFVLVANRLIAKLVKPNQILKHFFGDVLKPDKPDRVKRNALRLLIDRNEIFASDANVVNKEELRPLLLDLLRQVDDETIINNLTNQPLRETTIKNIAEVLLKLYPVSKINELLQSAYDQCSGDISTSDYDKRVHLQRLLVCVYLAGPNTDFADIVDSYERSSVASDRDRFAKVLIDKASTDEGKNRALEYFQGKAMEHLGFVNRRDPSLGIKLHAIARYAGFQPAPANLEETLWSIIQNATHIDEAAAAYTELSRHFSEDEGFKAKLAKKLLNPDFSLLVHHLFLEAVRKPVSKVDGDNQGVRDSFKELFEMVPNLVTKITDALKEFQGRFHENSEKVLNKFIDNVGIRNLISWLCSDQLSSSIRGNALSLLREVSDEKMIEFYKNSVFKGYYRKMVEFLGVDTKPPAKSNESKAPTDLKEIFFKTKASDRIPGLKPVYKPPNFSIKYLNN